MPKRLHVEAKSFVNCRVCGCPCLRPLVTSYDRVIQHHQPTSQPKTYAIFWCPDCHCGTTQAALDSYYWSTAYPKEYYTDYLGVGGTIIKVDQLMQIEATRGVSGARVLEIGCSQGDLLCLLRERGAIPVGVEPGETPRRIAISRGLDVVATPDEVRGSSFDIVLLFDVLEHLPDPVQSLQWVATKVSESGQVFIGVPNIESLEFQLLRKRWFALELPRHLTHFSPKALDRLAQRVGMIRRLTYFSKDGFFAKTFIDPRLYDNWAKKWPSLVIPPVRRGLRFIERVLYFLGNRPYFTVVLEKA